MSTPTAGGATGRWSARPVFPLHGDFLPASDVIISFHLKKYFYEPASIFVLCGRIFKSWTVMKAKQHVEIRTSSSGIPEFTPASRLFNSRLG